MARIRSVHPGIYTDEAWASVSITARWLGMGLCTEADDNGVFEWKPLQLKMRLFPADDVDANALLSELAGAGIVLAFDGDGRKLGAIRNFCKYQRPRKPKAWFPLTLPVRAFVALGTEPATDPDDEPAPVPQKSVPAPVQADPVPPKSEKSPQMEEGGGRMEEEKEGVVVVGARPLDVHGKPPVTDDWPRTDLTSWRNALAIAAGPGLADPAKEGSLTTSMGEINRWRVAGCSWELDVLPVVKGKTSQQTRSPIRSWTLFTERILSARDRRLAELPPPDPNPPQANSSHERPTADAKLAARQNYLERSFAGSEVAAERWRRENRG